MPSQNDHPLTNPNFTRQFPHIRMFPDFLTLIPESPLDEVVRLLLEKIYK